MLGFSWNSKSGGGAILPWENGGHFKANFMLAIHFTRPAATEMLLGLTRESLLAATAEDSYPKDARRIMRASRATGETRRSVCCPF
jgi:hypothetical protein